MGLVAVILGFSPPFYAGNSGLLLDVNYRFLLDLFWLAGPFILAYWSILVLGFF